MGIMIPWLADSARLTGYPVVEVAGWRGRGHGGMRVVEGVVCHHTGNPVQGDYPSLIIVRDGRSDLAGPLSHYGLGREGRIFVIAAGQCWHAGASRWAGYTDVNDEFIGIEAESRGDGSWTGEQRDCYPRLVAACLHYMRRGPDRAGAHREVALPPGRKPDPTGIDMNELRGRVGWLLGDPLARIPRGGQVIKPDEPFRPDPNVFPLPRTEYYGLASGPRESHGGAAGYEHERPAIRAIQQKLIVKGHVRGISDPNSGWADGEFGPPTKDSVASWQHAEMPTTTRWGEVWWDDWKRLFS